MPSKKSNNQNMVRNRLKSLVKRSDTDNIEICRLLHTIYEEDLYEEWGFERWEDYIAKDLPNISLYRARKLAGVGSWLEEHVYPHKKIWPKLEKMGWEAVWSLHKVADSEDIAAWVEFAETHTRTELRAEVRREMRRLGLAPDKEVYGFWVSNPQRKTVERAVRRAAQVYEGDHTNGELITQICKEFLSQNMRGKGKAKRKKA